MEARMWEALVRDAKQTYTAGPGEGAIPRPLIMPLARDEWAGHSRSSAAPWRGPGGHSTRTAKHFPPPRPIRLRRIFVCSLFGISGRSRTTHIVFSWSGGVPRGCRSGTRIDQLMMGALVDMVSTDLVPAGERLGFWKEVSARTWVPYKLRCEPQRAKAFHARMSIFDLGSLQVALMTATPYTIDRTAKLIRQTDPELCKLGVVVQGAGSVAQGDRQADFTVGDLVLYDTSRPYSATLATNIPTSQLLVLQFARRHLPIPCQDLRRLTAVRIPGTHGVGALSSQFLLQLAHHMHELSPADTVRLSTLTLDVLTTALADALDTQSVVPPHTRQRALMAQIHAFIRDHLGDTQLTPDAIAAAHHISLRYLHKLFQQEGHTVAGWIRERRLEQCRRDLANPQLAARPIHAIAARWGFISPAHFSQAFRSVHGLSPRQFRRQCATVHAG
ncbi:helix-turn-helix domain-containing protein [Streptomyces sp. NBC_00140]|uniref:AraC-like ligand-binding domain-containing protein n=1 Tax=Streptomyces sp. NBC_00140 TaxID=2975664 RepID=UPI00224D4AAB|nr:helix-turn-helix domain-containing protein [Streptomyces sp. NBC_00140]MCX5328284.1 helix-turn-helix domain-containing protein [Streptomyces sp. NBC_00140]